MRREDSQLADLNSLSFKIIENAEEIKSLKDFWVNNQWQHYTDFDYYINIVTHEKGVLKPYIIVVLENQKPIFLLIGNILERDFKLKFGYKSILRSKVQLLEIMYGGVLGNQSMAVCRETVSFLKKILSEEKIDYVFFKQLDITSNLYKAVKEFGGKLFISRLDLPNPHIYLDIPDSYEKFLETRTRNERHKIKRYTKRMEEKLHGKVEIKLYKSQEDIDTIMKDTYEIASKTYQSKIGVIMNDNIDTRRKIQYELQNKRLLVWIMYIEGKPVAYSLGILYKKILLGSYTGYLQEYRQYGPGSFLTVKMIKYSCDNCLDRFDFGFGDGVDKRKYCSSVNIESNTYIYSSTLKGLLLNFMGTFNRITLLLYRKLQRRFTIIRGIKRKSRDKLINNSIRK